MQVDSAIPRQKSEITAAWFNRVVVTDTGPALPAALEIELDISLNQGAMGEVVRLTPRYGDPVPPDVPRSFIIKLSSPEPAMRERPATRLGYFREVSFYRELGAGVGLPVPRCFFADMDRDSGHHVIVLEEISPVLSRPPDTGCALVEAERVVAALAAMHARWWESPALEGFHWLPEPAAVDGEALGALHRTWWPEFAEQHGELLTPEMAEFGRRLEKSFPPLMESLLFGRPRTLRHGDFGLSNLLFQPTDETGDADPAGFVVIDWQMISRGKGPWDLAWFLGQSLTAEQRWEWESLLLATYHESLVSGGVSGYGAAECLLDYRRALAQRLGTLISSLVALPFTPAQKARIRDVQLPRNLAAIADHGGLALLAELGLADL